MKQPTINHPNGNHPNGNHPNGNHTTRNLMTTGNLMTTTNLGTTINIRTVTPTTESQLEPLIKDYNASSCSYEAGFLAEEMLIIYSAPQRDEEMEKIMAMTDQEFFDALMSIKLNNFIRETAIGGRTEDFSKRGKKCLLENREHLRTNVSVCYIKKSLYGLVVNGKCIEDMKYCEIISLGLRLEDIPDYI